MQLTMEPLDEMLATARALDAGGFDTIWLAEAYPWWRKHGMEARSSTVVSALMARDTERLTIGWGIISPYTRHPVQVAMDARVVQEAAGPDRFILGFGTVFVLLGLSASAAGSALGQMVIRLGKHLGFRTINIVRRKELWGELKALGADEVLSSAEDDIPARVAQITGGAMVPYALDCVGGPGVIAVVQSLAPQGRVLLYGTLSNELIPLDPRALIGGQKAIEGFWLSEWVPQQGLFRMLGLFRQIIALMRAGVLTTPVAATYTLDQLPKAIEHVEKTARGGKILLRIGQA